MPPPPDDIDPAARAILRRAKRALVSGYGLNAADRDDLEQELALQAHLAKARHDPARGTAATFYARVIGNRLKDLLASRFAGRRDARQVVPLEAAPEPAVIEQERIDRALDVQDVLASLSSALRSTGQLLMESSPAEAGRRAGLTRGQVRQRMARLAEELTPLCPPTPAPGDRRPPERLTIPAGEISCEENPPTTTRPAEDPVYINHKGAQTKSGKLTLRSQSEGRQVPFTSGRVDARARRRSA